MTIDEALGAVVSLPGEVVIRFYAADLNKGGHPREEGIRIEVEHVLPDGVQCRARGAWAPWSPHRAAGGTIAEELAATLQSLVLGGDQLEKRIKEREAAE